MLSRCQRRRTIILPGLAIGLSGHIGQRVEPILWPQDDFVDGDIVRPLALMVEHASGIEVAIGRGIELSSVALQGMGAELFDIDRYWSCQALRPKRVKTHRAAVRIGAEGKPMLFPRLVAGDEWFTVLDCGGRP